MHSTHMTRLINEVVRLLEKGRTTNVNARMENGLVCYPSDPKACKWCLSGAVMKVTWYSYENNKNRDFDDLMNLFTAFTGIGITDWNDNTKDDSEIILGLLMAGIAYREGLVEI